MLEQEILTEKELEIYKRGRNTNSHTKAKNADVVTYRMSTGFEAVMGYLHLTDEINRLEELVAWCIQKWKKEQNSEKYQRVVPSGRGDGSPQSTSWLCSHSSAGPAMVATEGRRANRARENN